MMKKCGNKEIMLHRRFIKAYKKNTLALFLSFVLTFLLLTTMVVLIHTNHRIANIQAKTIYTPSDCYIVDLSAHQIEKLQKDNDIERLSFEQRVEESYVRNNQTLFLRRGDSTMITMTSSIIDGRLPEKKGEIVAEKWALLNLGIEPVTNQEFQIENQETGEKITLKLTGILEDMSRNKQYGIIDLYTPLDPESGELYTVFIKLKENCDFETKMKSLVRELEIENKQIRICPAREDYRELYTTDTKIIFVILLICMVVFYGIYRITLLTRQKQYGILRAIGMKRRQLQKMILLELYQIYCVSVPVGIACGLLTAFLVVEISGDRDSVVYFYGERVPFEPIIPVGVILICIILVTLLVGLVGYAGGKKIIYLSPVDAISGTGKQKNTEKSIFGIRRAKSKNSTLFHLGCKYIFKDIKTSCFVILTICLGVTLFTGLAYKCRTTAIYREDTKEMWYLNGQYEISIRRLGEISQGLSRESGQEIQKLPEVTGIKTASGIPVRVIDEDGIRRNDEYYDELNARMQEIYGFGNSGNDGVNQVYKSILYGYNETALKELKKYVIEGSYDPETMAEDEVILSILRTDDTKQNKQPGSYKEGTSLMNYQVGDSIQIKYRKDFKTDTVEYESFTDTDGEYVYKTYKIAAIVSFEYMLDCNRTVYPLLITSDSYVKSLVPDSTYQCMYIDGQPDMSVAEQIALEQKLIKIGSQNSDVTTRSMISEIRQNEMFYRKQLVYIYGIAIISFVLVLINMVNNLKYRMQIRTREICMLRAIGMSVAMTKRVMLFENMVLCAAAIMLGFVISHPVLGYLYKISDMKAMGHSFQYDYAAFFIVSAAALAICAFLSYRILKGWKTRHIMEEMGKTE